MAEKKPTNRRNSPAAGTHGVQGHAKSRKSTGQTEGQFGRDPKGRRGQYGSAGDPPLMKK